MLPQESPVRWNFWLSDGPAQVDSSNNSLGDRFRLGADAQLLQDYRLILGVTLFDILASGESSTDVGAISRYGFDLRAGYFLVPDALFVEYGLYLGEIKGSNIFGWSGTIGHSFGLGWRFLSREKFNFAVEANYLFIGSQTTATFNPFTGATGVSIYPRANVYSLNFRVGFDLGGGG